MVYSFPVAVKYSETARLMKMSTNRIITHASGEGGIFANAYLVQTSRGIVAVDATLTVSENRRLSEEVDA